MIEYKFANPKAFGNHWRPMSQFRSKAWNFNFSYYIYRIFNVVYEKDSAEFKNAVKQAKFMRKLTK